MLVIDSHQHFWNFDPVNHNWISDEMVILKRDFSPQDLKEVLEKNEVNACVAVQADQTEEETFYLLDLASENEFIKAVVGWVDLSSSSLEERLEYFSAFSKLKGFRHIVQAEPDPNFMLKGAFQNGLSLLEKYNFTYDILIFPNQFHAALETVKSFPNINFVIDHLAKPYIKDRKIKEWEEYIRKIAVYPNVHCKISGMVTEADWKNWTYNDFTPYLDIVFDAFGTDRLMFGSDWPVCLLGGSYARIKGIIDQYIQHFSYDDKSKIMGLNALNFYNIEIEATGIDAYSKKH